MTQNYIRTILKETQAMLRSVAVFTILVLTFFFAGNANCETPARIFPDNVTEWGGHCIGSSLNNAPDGLWSASCQVTTNDRGLAIRIHTDHHTGDPITSNIPRQPLYVRISNLAPFDLQPSLTVEVNGLLWFRVFPRSLEVQAFLRERGTVVGELETRIVRVTESSEPGVIVATFEKAQ